MKIKNTQFVNLSWKDVEKSCKNIAVKLNELNFIPDVIITPLKGGVIPAVIISHLLNTQHLITIVARRTENNPIEAKRKPVILDKLPRINEIRGKKILIFDEIADSGDTLEKIYSQISKLKPKQIITAVIVINSKRFNIKNRKPDIYVKEVDRWVVFPWELAVTS